MNSTMHRTTKPSLWRVYPVDPLPISPNGTGSSKAICVGGDAAKDLFQGGPVMIIERRRPLVCALVKCERLWVG
jgi:hypothetical protein